MSKKYENKDIIKNYIILLIPLVLFSCYKNGYILYSKNLVTLLYIFKPLIMFVGALITSFLIELIYSNTKKVSIVNTLRDSYLPLYGALFSLIVPVNINPFLYIFLLIGVLLISKLLFFLFRHLCLIFIIGIFFD